MIILGVDPGLLDAGLVVLRAEGDEPWPILLHQHWQPKGRHARKKTPQEWHEYAGQLHNAIVQMIDDLVFRAEPTYLSFGCLAVESNEGIRGSEGKRSYPAIMSLSGGYWTAVGVARQWRLPVLDYNVMDVRQGRHGLGAVTDGEVKAVLLAMGYPVQGWTTHEIDALAVGRHAGLMERITRLAAESTMHHIQLPHRVVDVCSVERSKARPGLPKE